MKKFVFSLLTISALGAAPFMVHSNLAVAAGADATRQKIDAINKSYSEVESLSKVETFKPLKLHGEMLSDLLETISKNPSGWTMQVGKETEMPITKESAAVLGIVIPVYWSPYPIPWQFGGRCDIIDGCTCVAPSTSGGVHICYRQ